MTRRLLTAVSLAAFVTGGLVVAAAPATAAEDNHILCIGGESQRQPGNYTGVCIGPRIGGTLLP